MAFRFFIAGDIHLGRRPGRVPVDLDAEEFTPRQAWHALVDRALAQRVDAVALTGDVVDQDNRFYEALSDLHGGVRKLLDAGIAVLAVAGNHDYNVLPRLARQIDGFRLLGQGGDWEAVSLGSAQGMPVRFVGWSFPRQHVSENPLASYRPTGNSMPTIGLLHCDCQTQTSSYGPVPLNDLLSREVDLWGLGHIHRGGLLGDGAPVFYTGSPQGLDPSETGPHGAWLVTLEPGQRPRAELEPLAALQWESLAIPLEGADCDSAIEDAVHQATQRLHQTICAQSGVGVRAVGCRVRLTGRTPLHRSLSALGARLIEDYRPNLDGIAYFVESVQNETRPDVALEELARSSDPAGLLAQRLLVLDRREPATVYEDLLARARESIAAQVPGMVFASLPGEGEPLTDDQVREVLLQAGFAALDQLLAQKEAHV